MWTKSALVCLLLGAVVGVSEAHPEEGELHAVIVAGSAGYGNYRHQADACHAYRVLIEHGVKPENVILMMENDVVNHTDNPYPGRLFNRPLGYDVYENCTIDYERGSVTPENFMAVLRGNASEVNGGNGRVLKSGPNDRVFVNFVDHGAAGILAFPKTVLTAKDLKKTLTFMHKHEKYGQLVFYVEACESGSMFEGILPNDTNVYVVTAANGDESSWAAYMCEDLETLLGDVFSIRWMEQADLEFLQELTLEQHYEVIKALTPKSHVSRFGDLSIANQPAANFLGEENPPEFPRQNMSICPDYHHEPPVPVRELPIRLLERQIERTNDATNAADLKRQLAEIHEKRAHFDRHADALVAKIAGRSRVAKRALDAAHYEPVRDLDCHDRAVKTFSRRCFQLATNPYAMKMAGVLNKLCNAGVGVERIVGHIEEHCGESNDRMVGIV
ncbi:Legumain [Aphelenchoides fujianensis]|nr:Legumain [Aphelenchoides fujianensis]